MEAVEVADLIRFAFLVTAALYAGIAFAVLRRYFTSPPRSRLRRFHVIGVSTGTTVLVIAQAGGVYDRFGTDLPWYGAPTGFLGVAILVAALAALFAAEGRARRGLAPEATDYPLAAITDAGPGQRAAEAADQAYAHSRAGDAARATEAADTARATSLAREARAAEAAAAAELARDSDRARAARASRRSRRTRRSEDPTGSGEGEGQEAEEGQGSHSGGE